MHIYREESRKAMKLVSVIIPTYNRGKMLSECVDSILKSTYTNLEVLIVDNNSTDNTVELMQDRFERKSDGCRRQKRRDYAC